MNSYSLIDQSDNNDSRQIDYIEDSICTVKPKNCFNSVATDLAPSYAQLKAYCNSSIKETILMKQKFYNKGKHNGHSRIAYKIIS